MTCLCRLLLNGIKNVLINSFYYIVRLRFITPICSNLGYAKQNSETHYDTVKAN